MNEVLTEFEASATQLITLLERIVAAGKLDVPRSEGKWTPRFIVHHLADSEVLQSMRFPAMLTTENYVIVPGQQDATANLTEYAKRDPFNSARAFAAMRVRNAELLSVLSNLQLERKTVHPKYGEFRILSWAERVLNHDMLHFAQLEESLI